MSRTWLAQRHINDLHVPWTKRPSQLDTSQQEHNCSARSGLTTWAKQVFSSCEAGRWNSDPLLWEACCRVPLPSTFPKTEQQHNRAEFWCRVRFCSPSSFCLNAINRSAPATTCYLKCATFGLSIKPQILRISSFVMIHIITSLCSSNTNILL